MKRIKHKSAKTSRVPKRRRKGKQPDPAKEYVGYNEPVGEAERIKENLNENNQNKNEMENQRISSDFSKEDLPESTHDDLGPEVVRNDVKPEK